MIIFGDLKEENGEIEFFSYSLLDFERWSVPPAPVLSKNFGISEFSVDDGAKSPLYPSPSRLTEGRLEIVTDARRDAVDVAAPLTNGAEADGEVVWS
jgi:hypothetical protein